MSGEMTEKERDFSKGTIVLMNDSRNFKKYRARKLSDREKLYEIHGKIATMYGNELDDYDKAYIAMMSSGVTVYDIIDEI